VPNTLAKPAINKSMIATMQYEAFRAMLDSVIAARGPKNLTVESLITDGGEPRSHIDRFHRKEDLYLICL